MESPSALPKHEDSKSADVSLTVIDDSRSQNYDRTRQNESASQMDRAMKEKCTKPPCWGWVLIGIGIIVMLAVVSGIAVMIVLHSKTDTEPLPANKQAEGPPAGTTDDLLAGNSKGPSTSHPNVPSTFSSAQVVSRNEWGARAPRARSEISTPISMLFIHHTVSAACYNLSQCSLIVRGIQNYHMDDKGWSDIGYSFLVGEDGRVYEGRGWGIEGAHTYRYNSKSIGIGFIGNFTGRLPSREAIRTGLDFISYGEQRGHLSLPEIFGHRDSKCTLCPGDSLYQEITSWPGYSNRSITKYC